MSCLFNVADMFQNDQSNHYLFNQLSGWYLTQKPVGGSKAGGLTHPTLSSFPPLPLSIPPILSLPVGGKVRSSGGGSSPASPLQIPPCIQPKKTLILTYRKCLFEIAHTNTQLTKNKLVRLRSPYYMRPWHVNKTKDTTRPQG